MSFTLTLAPGYTAFGTLFVDAHFQPAVPGSTVTSRLPRITKSAVDAAVVFLSERELKSWETEEEARTRLRTSLGALVPEDVAAGLNDVVRLHETNEIKEKS